MFHAGPLQWMTNLAGKLWPGQMAAGTDRHVSYSQRCMKCRHLSVYLICILFLPIYYLVHVLL